MDIDNGMVLTLNGYAVYLMCIERFALVEGFEVVVEGDCVKEHLKLHEVWSLEDIEKRVVSIDHTKYLMCIERFALVEGLGVVVEGNYVKKHLKVHEVWSLESCVTSVVPGGLDSGDPPVAWSRSLLLPRHLPRSSLYLILFH